VVTATGQQTGERGREPLRTLACHRKIGQDLLFAVDLIPGGGGEFRFGGGVAVVG
jgi:hypothetical protein